jgi:DNA polymerase I
MVDLSQFSFMLIDLDYKIKDTDKAPTIRLFGKTEKEKVIVVIKDFLPYFLVTHEKGIEDFIEKDPIIKKWKRRIEETKKKRYFGGEELKLIKLSGSHPEQTPAVRTRFKEAGYEIHEADIPFIKRFLLDLGLRGLNVLTVNSTNIKKEKNTVFIDASYKQIKPISKEVVSSADYFYKLKIMAFDIEIDHQQETIQQLLSSKSKRIVAISSVWGTNQFDSSGKTFILRGDTNQDEIRLIQEFIEEVNSIQPDVLITFNGDNFDIPYLLARMEKLSIPSALFSIFQNDSVFYSNRNRCYRIKGRISYDISPRTWGIHPISGKKGLGDIAETVLGHGKIEIEKSTGELWRSGFLHGNKANQKKLEEYSLTDSELTYELTWKLGVQGWLEVIRLTGYPPGEAPGSTERIQGEFELMRFAGIQNVLIPMAPSDAEVARRRAERKKNPHTGGTVLIPKGTLHFGVIISDFRSMYPSVCVAHNIGGESLKRVKDIEDANPLELFHSKPQSCLSLMEESLIQRREQTKEVIKVLDQKLKKITDEKKRERLSEERVILDKEQYSMKIVANSMYGSHNYIRSRFYSITLGNAITNIARTYILQMEKLLKEVSNKITPVDIIYGDTDSAFIKILDESFVINAYNEKNPKKKQKYLDKLIDITNSILKNLNSKFPEAMELTL